MSRPAQSVQKAVSKALSPDLKIGIGVSGGLDSISLLHEACTRASGFRCRVAAIHIDHSLRESSGLDSDFVRDKAKSYDIPFYSTKLKAPISSSSEPSVNIEAWGRQARYAFFEQVRKEHQLDCLWTAHTASDVSETFLMRLFANKELRTIHDFDSRRFLHRPLLCVSREVIEQYARSLNLEFREDPSNTDLSFTRNMIRHEVLPYLSKKFGTDVAEVLCAQSSKVALDIETLDGVAHDFIERLVDSLGLKSQLECLDNLVVLKKSLLELDEPFRWRVIEALFRPVLGFGLSRSKSQEVVRVILAEQLAAELPGGKRVSRGRGRVLITP